MIAPDIADTQPAADAAKAPPFGSNDLRLNAREWAVALIIVLAFMVATPRIWKKLEPFPTGPDYRIPYALSKDYWLYQRRLEQVARPANVLVLGDSVIWGEYVRPNGTLTHFLNQKSGSASSPRADSTGSPQAHEPVRFINCGVNGLFPLAMEGLIEHHGGAIRNMRVIVHCNVLWMTSPRADLSEHKAQNFNHSGLIPQFFPRIPSYGADANTRLGAVLDNHVQFFAWTGHLQSAYFGQQSIPQWTLAEDDNDPPRCPNAWRDPLDVFKAGIPAEPKNDPDRGPSSPRHRPWNAGGAGPSSFEWVSLDKSIQWAAFQRVVWLLRSRGNDVLVVLGPFNEHMIDPDQRPTFQSLCNQITAWLNANHFPLAAPPTLPPEMYADASHPLTQGYARLADELLRDPRFKRWLRRPQ